MIFHRYQLGPIVGVIILILLFWYFDISQVLGVLADIDLTWFCLAVGLILFTTIIGAISLNLLLNCNGEVPLKRFIPIFWLAWALALVTPGQVGDVVSLPILLRRFGLFVHVSVGRILLDKMISFFVTASFALWGLIFLLDSLPWSMGGAPWLMAMASIGFVLMVWQRTGIMKYLDVSRDDWRGKIGRTVVEFFDTLRLYPLRVWINCLLTLLKIVITGISYWVVFAALGYSNVTIIDVIPLMAISSLVAYLPISFNGLGTVEIAGVLLFATLGIPEVVVFSAYMILRSIILVVAWGPASIVLMMGSNARKIHE